ncbi:VanZ family protein [Heyndrickxia faecalis]|nr:VanZ family protein [Weizmannia sp. CD-2023]
MLLHWRINERVTSIIDFIVRKLAHSGFLEMLLVILLKKPFLWPWMITTLYAGTDEYHQSLVPGRTPSIYDVVLDFCGAFLALEFLIILFKKFQKKLNILI